MFPITPFDGKCRRLQMSRTHFCAIPYRFWDITVSHFYNKKAGQDHEAQFLQLHHSMAHVKMYKYFPHIFVIFCRLRYITIFNLQFQNRRYKRHHQQLGIQQCSRSTLSGFRVITTNIPVCQWWLPKNVKRRLWAYTWPGSRIRWHFRCLVRRCSRQRVIVSVAIWTSVKL